MTSFSVPDKTATLFHGGVIWTPTTTTDALLVADGVVQAVGDDALASAALLHDVGHLLHGLPEDVAERGVDGRHEEAGARWLRDVFGPAVAEPVRLHVAAKRYLCAVEPGYRAALSAASELSLQLQGGPFTADEVRRFEREPYWDSAVAVRRWDDGAKVPGLRTPGLEHYRSRLQAVLDRPENP